VFVIPCPHCAVPCCVQWQHPGVMLGMQMQPMGGGGPMSHGQGMMAQPPSAGQGGGGLVETSSIKPSDAIKADHIITCGELELNVPIGVGAEGKVGVGVGGAVLVSLNHCEGHSCATWHLWLWAGLCAGPGQALTTG
jgi:hypothetical protein